MFIYEIIVGEYEYQSEYLLCHEKEYTQEEFIKIVQGAIKYLQKRKPEDKCVDNSDVLDVLEGVYNFKRYKLEIKSRIAVNWSMEQILDL